MKLLRARFHSRFRSAQNRGSAHIGVCLNDNRSRHGAVPLAASLHCEMVKNALLARSKAPEQQCLIRLKIAKI